MILLCWAATFGTDAAARRAPRRDARCRRRGARRELGAARPRDARGPLLPRHGAAAYGGRRDRRPNAPAPRRAGIPRDQDARRTPRGPWDSGPRPSGAAATPSARGRSRAKQRRCSTKARPACSTRRRCFSRCTTPASTSADLEEARLAIARGVPRLVTRMRGLAGTPYARAFLTQLTPNAGLLAAGGGLRPGARGAELDPRGGWPTGGHGGNAARSVRRAAGSRASVLPRRQLVAVLQRRHRAPLRRAPW